MAIRRRIGLLVPSTNSVAEPDFHAAVPPGVTVHSHRLQHEVDINDPKIFDVMNSGLAQGARYLAAARVEVICMAGTTNSYYKGMSGTISMEEVMSRAGGVPAVASSSSIVQALRYYGARRLSVATPYPKWHNDRLVDYLVEAGFEVLNLDSDPRVADGDARRINDQDPSEILDFAVSVCRDEADALFCSCSAWRALEVAGEIERRIGRPVITTNQATIWRTLKKMEIERANPGFGRLLEEMPPIEDPVAAIS